MGIYGKQGQLVTPLSTNIMSSPSKFNNFLETPFRTFFSLWVPVLFSMVAEPFTGLVDTAFISRLGAEALAALGVGAVILTSGLWLFNFLSVGSQTEVSQACGKQDIERGKRIGSLAVFMAITIGSVLGILILILAPSLSTLMGATGAIHSNAVTYIQIRAFGGPAVLITMTSFGILYGLADMRSPLFIAITVNVMNIVLDYLMIFGVGPIPAMGIAGAALASTISQWAGVVLCVYVVQKKLGLTHRVDISDVKKLLTIGHDMIMRTGSLLLFLILATRSATQLGPESGAAHQAIRQIWVFTALFLDASAVSAQSLIGYFFGSEEIQKARKVSLLVCQWSLMIGVALMLLMFVGVELIASLLVPQSGLALFYPAWIVAAIFQPAASIAFVTDGIHWGTGDFKYLRNGVVFATICGCLSLILLEVFNRDSLTLIWWVTGGWILIRAILGVLRIWPGSDKSPLGTAARKQCTPSKLYK